MILPHIFHPLTEHTCWCNPFRLSQHQPWYALHRADPEYVFWEHDEQGPGASYQYGAAAMSDDNQPISVPVDREEIARLQRQEQARYDRERLMFVADRGEDDGYWYVRDLNEMCRPASHRAESVALIADQWPDGGEEAAKVITNALNKHYAERSE